MGILEKNYAGQECYLVNYDEEQWNKYSPEAQEQTMQAWVKKAKPMGAEYVVLRLHPDPLFPAGDKTAPYVARSVPIDQGKFDPFKVAVELKCEIDSETWRKASEGERMKLKTDARARLAMNAMTGKGCAYEIWVRMPHGEPTVLERSRF